MRRLSSTRGDIKLVASLLAAGVVLAMPSDRLSASSSSPDLVAYQVTWHARVQGSVPMHLVQGTLSNWYELDGESFHSELEGSAIVRIRKFNGQLVVGEDMRYSKVSAQDDRVVWRYNFDPKRGDCLTRVSRSILEPNGYSGTHVTSKQGILQLLAPTQRQGAGYVMKNALHGLSDLYFTEPWETRTYGAGCGSRGDGSVVAAGKFERSNPLVLTGMLENRKLDLRSESDDLSYLSANARFTAKSGTVSVPLTIEWTASARQLGKCAERNGPIPDSDPIVEDEEVSVDADNTQIGPDGGAKVTVRVSCDGVPIRDAETDLTIDPQARSGGHAHTDKRPHGKLNGKDLTDDNRTLTVKTDANGAVIVKFEPPGKTAASKNVGIAGVYEIKATSKRFAERSSKVAVFVGFPDLTSLPESPDAVYEVVRGGTDKHPNGTFATAGTLRAFQSLAADFYQSQKAHNDQLTACGMTPWKLRKASFNDIALADGGLFDWKGSWAPPHQTHGRGQGGDFNHFHETGKLKECNGTQVTFDNWLTAVLLELGQTYGHWDTWDLAQPEHFLHLHVED